MHFVTKTFILSSHYYHNIITAIDITSPLSRLSEGNHKMGQYGFRARSWRRKQKAKPRSWKKGHEIYHFRSLAGKSGRRDQGWIRSFLLPLLAEPLHEHGVNGEVSLTLPAMGVVGGGKRRLSHREDTRRDETDDWGLERRR